MILYKTKTLFYSYKKQLVAQAHMSQIFMSSLMTLLILMLKKCTTTSKLDPPKPQEKRRKLEESSHIERLSVMENP